MTFLSSSSAILTRYLQERANDVHDSVVLGTLLDKVISQTSCRLDPQFYVVAAVILVLSVRRARVSRAWQQLPLLDQEEPLGSEQ